jgi:hypothetical protein
LASDSGHREKAGAAFQELEALVRRLGEELASFRRRALNAEAQLKKLEAAGSGEHAAVAATGSARGNGADDGSAARLERENAELRARLEAASDRTRQMLERVRFLRQQQDAGAEK